MGRPELQFQNFTRGGLKVELCQTARSLGQLWQFRNAIFRGGMQGDDRDIWDETYLNFCIKNIDKNEILGCFRLGIFPSGTAAVHGLLSAWNFSKRHSRSARIFSAVFRSVTAARI